MKTICVVLMCTLIVALSTKVDADCNSLPSNVFTKSQGPWKTGAEIVDDPGTCTKRVCQANGGWSGLTCAEFRCPESYKYTPMDITKDYPDCCPKCEEY